MISEMKIRFTLIVAGLMMAASPVLAGGVAGQIPAVHVSDRQQTFQAQEMKRPGGVNRNKSAAKGQPGSEDRIVIDVIGAGLKKDKPLRPNPAR